MAKKNKQVNASNQYNAEFAEENAANTASSAGKSAQQKADK
ncbi:hypothetical protein [Paenibacillus xanthanilyticus]|uniref:YfhE family protein n=1 Tax=Paenibacillus xanthanilyticus TaxID=1783531 RepID=A0ABV8KAB5_9BACL